MNYVVFSGPEGEEKTFEGTFDSQDEAMALIGRLEDKSGLFCKMFTLGGDNLEYATSY